MELKHWSAVAAGILVVAGCGQTAREGQKRQTAADRAALAASDAELDQDDAALALTVAQEKDLGAASRKVRLAREELDAILKEASRKCRQLEGAIASMEKTVGGVSGELPALKEVEDLEHEAIERLDVEKRAKRHRQDEVEARLEVIAALLKKEATPAGDKDIAAARARLTELIADQEAKERRLRRLKNTPASDLSAEHLAERAKGWPTITAKIEELAKKVAAARAELEELRKKDKVTTADLTAEQTKLETEKVDLTEALQRLNNRIKHHQETLAAAKADSTRITRAKGIDEEDVPEACAKI